MNTIKNRVEQLASEREHLLKIRLRALKTNDPDEILEIDEEIAEIQNEIDELNK